MAAALAAPCCSLAPSVALGLLLPTSWRPLHPPLAPGVALTPPPRPPSPLSCWQGAAPPSGTSSAPRSRWSSCQAATTGPTSASCSPSGRAARWVGRPRQGTLLPAWLGCREGGHGGSAAAFCVRQRSCAACRCGRVLRLHALALLALTLLACWMKLCLRAPHSLETPTPHLGLSSFLMFSMESTSCLPPRPFSPPSTDCSVQPLAGGSAPGKQRCRGTCLSHRPRSAAV